MKLNAFEGARRIVLAFSGLWVVGCLAYAVFTEPYASIQYAVVWPGKPIVTAERCANEDATEHITAQTIQGGSIAVTLCFTAHRSEDGQLLVPYAALPATTAEELASWIVTHKDERGTPEFDTVAKAYSDATTKLKSTNVAKTTSKPWELYAALEAADAKGDAEQAKKIADEIRAMPPGSRPAVRYLMNGPYTPEVRDYVAKVSQNFVIPEGDMKDADQSLWNARLEQWKQAIQLIAGGLAIVWILTIGIGWIVRGFMGVPRGKDVRPNP